MPADPSPPQALLAEFRVASPTLVDETAIATIWKVRVEDGEAAALKVYKGSGMSNERAGYAFLRALDGEEAAKVFAISATAALIEWLPGPSLGDLVREGDDAQAAAALVAAANAIHRRPIRCDAALPRLEGWFEPLFSIDISDSCPEPFRKDFLYGRELARALCADQRDIRPLHGDLHHDNVRRAARGYCVFDAKGVLGERAYELANAFRNPKGAPELVRNPARIRHLRDLWSDRFAVDPHRLMQWAAAKCALSIAWRNRPVLETDPEADLLSILVELTKQP